MFWVSTDVTITQIIERVTITHGCRDLGVLMASSHSGQESQFDNYMHEGRRI
jgi:hypothetical protein